MKNILHIPKGIRLISWATAVRFIGWGFVEMFIPVFLLSFVSSFTKTGLLKSIYEVVFLLSLPVISHFADRGVSSKKIILTGLVLYPIIAISYFLAGLYGAVIFIIIARLVNGLSFALDSVGKKTYMRRYAHDHVGMIFGYFDTISNFWWLAAAVAGLFLIRIFPLHELFLLIIPTTIVAIVLIFHIPHERKGGPYKSRNFLKEIWIDYKEMFGFIKHWTLEQKYTALLYAFMIVIFVFISFFIPLISFVEYGSCTLIFLLSAFAILPYLFGVPLGFLADKAGAKELWIAGLSGVGLLAILPFVDSLWIILPLIFLVGLAIYYVMLVLERCATLHEKRSHMGSLSGAFLSMTQLGQIGAPIGIGFLIDQFDFSFAIWTVCLIGLVVLAPLAFGRVKMFEAK